MTKDPAQLFIEADGLRPPLNMALGSTMLLARSIALHKSKIEPKRGSPIGALEGDVAALQTRLGIQLPQAYREYLLWMGGDYRGLLQGSNCFITDVEGNAEDLADLLQENGVPELSYRPIVFFMHQGYIAYWFNASDQTTDPVIFSFSESNKTSGIRTPGTFSEWLYKELLSLSQDQGH